MEQRQNQPSTSEDSCENYYLQEHYLEDIHIIPGFKDHTFNSHVDNVSNPKKSEGSEEDEVMSPTARDYLRFLDKNGGSKRFKNRVEKSSHTDVKSSSLPVSTISTRRRINLVESIKLGNWKVSGKRIRCPNSICKCNCPSLPLASPKDSRLNCVVEEESEAVNLPLGLKESINQAEELGVLLFKKRKVDEDVDETEYQDSSDVNKIKPLVNNESDMENCDRIMMLSNPNCSVDSVGSSPQNPMSPEKYDVKEIDHHDEQQSNLNPSEDVKQPADPMCSNDSEINMMPKDKKNTIRIVIAPKADSESAQEFEKRGSDGSKEYKCTTCGASFKSFQALGGHETTHRIIVRRERIGDDDRTLKLPNPKCSDDFLGCMPQKPKQESQKRGSDESKEYKCTACGVSFKSFCALGGHRSSHTRSERVGDDNQVKENRLKMMNQALDFLFKKRKVDEHVETVNLDSSNDDKVNEFELKKNNHTLLLLPNPKCSDDSSSSRPQKPNQESQKRGSVDSKEYKCTTCGVSFKSSRALGGHKSNHTIRIRREKVTNDDSQVKEKKKIKKSSCGSEEVASHGCNLCPKSYNTLKQLRMHQRCHGLNVGSHDHTSQLPSTPSTVLLFDLNEPAPAEDSDFSSPAS